MKKLASIFLCVLLCLSLVACGGETTPENLNEEAKATLMKVLNKEQTFSYTCMVFGKTTEETLEKFSFHLPYQASYAFVPQAYAFQDQGADGIEELLVRDVRSQCILFLNYDDGKVIGIIKDNFDSRDYQDLGWVNMEY